MDLIKGYLDESDDDLQDEQMAVEPMAINQPSDQTSASSQTNGSGQTNKIDQTIGSDLANRSNHPINRNQQISNQQTSNQQIRSHQTNESNATSDSESDRLIVKELIEELILAVERGNAKSDRRGESAKRKPATRRRNADEIAISSDESSSDESSSSESESSFEMLSADEANSDAEEIDLDRCLIRMAPLKTKGEMLIEELPPPEEECIQLNCDVDRLQQIGSVTKILENLVMVESFKNLPALDLDSVLFFRTGKSIGRVFDVIGSVSKPFYVIRFASSQKVTESAIFVNMPVYFVPPDLCLASFRELNVTKYVLVSQLKSSKGTDASWLHNNEPPENVKEYSDDEEERKDKMKQKAKRKVTTGGRQNGQSNWRKV